MVSDNNENGLCLKAEIFTSGRLLPDDVVKAQDRDINQASTMVPVQTEREFVSGKIESFREEGMIFTQLRIATGEIISLGGKWEIKNPTRDCIENAERTSQSITLFGNIKTLKDGSKIFETATLQCVPSKEKKIRSIEVAKATNSILTSLENDIISRNTPLSDIIKKIYSIETSNLNEILKEDLEEIPNKISKLYSKANAAEQTDILNLLNKKFDNLKDKHEGIHLTMYKDFIIKSTELALSLPTRCGMIENSIKEQCIKNSELNRSVIRKMNSDAYDTFKKICKVESLKLCSQMLKGFPEKYKQDYVSYQNGEGVTIFEFACAAAKAGAYKEFAPGNFFSNEIKLVLNGVTIYFERVHVDEKRMQEVSTSSTAPNIITFLKTTALEGPDGKKVKKDLGYESLQKDYTNIFGGMPELRECETRGW